MTAIVKKWSGARVINPPVSYNTDIIDKTRHKSLRQRVEEFYGKSFDEVVKNNPYEFDECDTGEPVGQEIW